MNIVEAINQHLIVPDSASFKGGASSRQGLWRLVPKTDGYALFPSKEEFKTKEVLGLVNLLERVRAESRRNFPENA